MEATTASPATRFVRSFCWALAFWWWRAAVRPLRKGVRRVFETYDIEMICPATAPCSKGRELVKKQFDVLDAVLPISTAARSRAATSRRACAPNFGGSPMNDVSPQSAGMSSQTLSKRPMRARSIGVWWLGDCLGQLYNGKIYHG